MNHGDISQLAARIQAMCGAAPTFVLIRELRLFEIEFASLEFAEESVLPLIDWGVLALTRVLRVASPREIDALLGLGELVSEAIVRRLVDEQMLVVNLENAEAERTPRTADRGVVDFFRRLLRREKRDAETSLSVQHTEPIELSPSLLRASSAADLPRVSVTAHGLVALERGEIVRRRRRSIRTVFSADPLYFVTTIDEKKQRHTQHQRGAPIDGEDVPRSFLFLDEVLGLPPEQRVNACGIESSFPGVRGELVGVVPGETWEVRRLPDKRNARPIVAVALFAGSVGAPVARVYTRIGDEMIERSNLDSRQLVNADPGILETVSAVPLAPQQLRSDGAFQYVCHADELQALLAAGDRPNDVYVMSSKLDGWTLGTRLHLAPADDETAKKVFLEYVSRNKGDLSTDFDATYARIAALLDRYWETNVTLPSPDDVAAELWPRTELREALCRRRLQADLVAPYEDANGRG